MNNYQNPYQMQYPYSTYQAPRTIPTYPMQTTYTPQPAFTQDGTIPARLVSGREEAVASNVIPGSMFMFYDRAHGMVYSKFVDPQTGMADFRSYRLLANQPEEPQETRPEYVTTEMFGQFKTELERRFEAIQHTARKAVNEDV